MFRESCYCDNKNKLLIKRAELRDLKLVLPRWEAVHAAGGGQRGAELRGDYYGGFPPVEGC